MLGLGTIARKVFGTPNDRKVKSVRPLVDRINALEDQFKTLSDEGLKDKTAELKSRFAAGESLDKLLPEAFANCREGARRALGLRAFDVQLMGGIFLHQGNDSADGSADRQEDSMIQGERRLQALQRGVCQWRPLGRLARAVRRDASQVSAARKRGILTPGRSVRTFEIGAHTHSRSSEESRAGDRQIGRSARLARGLRGSPARAGRRGAAPLWRARRRRPPWER